MTEIARLDDRVTKLEREMPEVRKLAAGASTEAGDVHARLRAHTKSLEALRETQLEQGEEFRERFARLESKVDHGFSMVAVAMAQITAQLSIATGESEGPDES